MKTVQSYQPYQYQPQHTHRAAQLGGHGSSPMESYGK